MRINTRGVDFQHADPEYEFVVSDGQILIPRLHWETISNAFMHRDKEDTTKKVCQKSLRVPSAGRLQTMCWEEAEIVSPGEGEILVETRAAGLNFKDLLISLGVLLNERPMGLEGSGVVTEVGPGVQDFVVGDRVLYFGSGCFSTHLKLPEKLCAKLEDSISFEMGAALPAVYTTAYMAITELSNLQSGQSILIQSACGGVGLAAIHLAQMIGAEIYCTVGSEIKADYLVQHYGIERARILHSRDVSFLHDLMRLTDNRGVDVVLNSLSGELLRASWLCLAECGTMVEIGKRDFQRRAKLTMEPFEQNRSFIGFDLARLTEIQPERSIKALRDCVDLVRSGKIPGPTIDSIHPAANVQDAFRTMQSAQHIGKIVVQMPDDASKLESVAPRPIPEFKSDRSYLIVGGLGGLGRVVASWMVENGARNLVFLSRSAREGPDNQDYLDELRSQVCQVQLVAGSVAKLEDVQQATCKSVQPLAGIIQMSMALKEEKDRIAQELRKVDTKYNALQAKLAQLSAGYEADKTGLSHSLRRMLGDIAVTPGSPSLPNPLPTSNDTSIENVQVASCQLNLSQSSVVEVDAPRPTNNQPGATRTGRVSRPPRRYSSIPATTSPARPSPDSSTKNTRAAARGLSSQPGHRTVTNDTPPNNRAKRDRQCYEESPGAASGHARKKTKTAAASEEPYTVDFDEVFQDGLALHKHMIIQYPPESDRWYLLRCDDHGLHFNQNPLHGAARHMRAAEHRGPKRHLDINTLKDADSWSLAIQTMGLRVSNCDATKAQQNNTAFTQALDAGYKPIKPESNKTPAPSQIISQPQPAPREQEVLGNASRLSTEPEWSEDNGGELITHPLEGKPYLGYWRSGSRGQVHIGREAVECRGDLN
ncbi:hypothetical protein PG989_005651 [Apiospora arundinis]